MSRGRRAVTVGALSTGVASAIAARGAYRALRRYPPAGEQTWTRTNHRRELVTLLEGPAVAVGAITAEVIAAAVAGRQGKGQIPQSSERTLGSRSSLALVVTGGGALGFGVLDDLAGSGKRRGLKGHLGALRQGEVTTGTVKLAAWPRPGWPAACCSAAAGPTW